MRGLWGHGMAGVMIALACLPVAALLVARGGAPVLAQLIFAGLVVLGWQFAFRAARGVPMSAAGAVTAVACLALAGGGLSAVQILLGVSFGVVLAELVFGGWGRNVIGAPAAALAFLYLSYPGLLHPAPDAWLALASLPGAGLLLATGFLSWRVLTGTALGAAAVLAAFDATPPWGALVFGAIFLVGDPATSAATRGGRGAYGFLAGALAGLFTAAGAGMPQAIVFAAILAAIFAPLIDHAAIAASLHGRRGNARD